MIHKDNIDTEILNNLIFGRVEPQIYAFTTETIPNYLKIGDTYRPIEKRLNEWRKYFPNLEKKFQVVAKINNETFFRDFSIHKYLEDNAQKTRLLPDSLQDIPYYSNEFFKDTTITDLDDAVTDIKNSYKNQDSKYKFYNIKDRKIGIIQYNRIESYEPRPNQQETINKFIKATDKGRNNLLMYAVMRFGKSFTSMCCALEIKAKVVLIVSAKADVKEEWKKTIESHKKFIGYSFLDSDSLLGSNTAIQDKIKLNMNVALFLTLQDLQGDNKKTKHTELFETQVNLLIIDETHFGARAEEYGKVLKDLKKTEIKGELALNDDSLDQLDTTIKEIKSDIRIHLSGTPYRILMNSEFTKDDIIAFYQFTDIAEEQKQWNDRNLMKDEIKEWDNPYYGFPQMIRFAFNPNESSRKIMLDLKKKGITYTFSELFKPKSKTNDKVNELHKKFTYEQEVIDLLKVIDGSQKDDNLLGFLDYDKIKDGKMCRHIVCVLPYRASCDAFEELIKSNKFKNLNSYQIINISGVDGKKKFKDTLSVKSLIKKHENENRKTITLTVNRMLTGSTVPEWDTMLYLKDTASPQEYDQAIFRLQSQFIKVYEEENGDVVKYNMKPQTLLVDFNPNRMFEIQEQKSQIYNANMEVNGNDGLKKHIKRELSISPIVVINNNKIVQVEPTDVLDAVRNYSSKRSVLDEAQSIGIDYSLLKIEAIKSVIDKQEEIGSRQGLKIKPSKGEGDDLNTNSENDNDSREDGESSTNKDHQKNEETSYKEKFAMYYARILFFAFLTNSRISSLNEAIHLINNNKTELRIASNLNLESKILLLFHERINPFILNELDYKIHNINSLANDFSIEPVERVSNAMKRFGRLSDSEVITPEDIADRIISTIPETSVNNETKILDIASKQGEFVYAIYKKFNKDIANNVYSIPTSKIAYEFTRKVYTLLNLNLDNIEKSYTSYDLVEANELINNKGIKINDSIMNFDVIVGNPPYQKQEEGDNKNTTIPIYQNFVTLARDLNPAYISIIMPARWYAGGRGLDGFRKEMLNDPHISELHDFIKTDLVFQNINIRGGLCYFLWDKNYDNNTNLTNVFSYIDDLNPLLKKRSLRTEGSDILIRHSIGIDIIDKVNKNPNFKSFSSFISAAKAFGFRTYFIKDIRFRENTDGILDPIKCYGRNKSIGYVERNEIQSNKKWIDAWKVYVPESNNIGTELNDDNQNAFVGAPGTICTETFLVVGAELSLDEYSSSNLCSYLKTTFARFMHSLTKISQHGTSKTYNYVPLQNFTSESDIDWSKSIDEIDKQLYKKYALNEEEVLFIERMIKPV